MTCTTMLKCCFAATCKSCAAQIVSELVESCRKHAFTDIVIVHEHRGEPDGLVVCHLPYGPTAYFGIYNAVCLGYWRVTYTYMVEH
jgi:rRNA maturation protein Rpf1